ncbi:tripartite tricarboxylate transporter substrate binding protein [Xylophilus sp. Kf1]|nr:tripartite tricarboxylate transporter substrate binding protein [Xylophilus sp. Kf1]
MSRKKTATVLLSCLLGLAALAACAPSRAQAPAQPAAWPTRPVRLVVGLAPGGLADVLVRAVQPHLSAALGQPVLVDNRGGAGGNVAGVEVVHNGGDGHTFLITPTTTESVNPSLFARMPFEPQRDLRPVGLLADSKLFLFVRASLGVDSTEAFIAYARAHPGQLTYGSAGNGTTPHLSAELLKQATGITAVHAPYRGVAPAMQDLVAGQIDFAFGPATSFAFVQTGKLKVLAVASRGRAQIAPEVRTFQESGIPGVYGDSMFGVYAPAGMRPEAVERMNRELNKVLERPDIRARFLEAGAEALPLSPADYAARVQAETRVFSAIVKSKNLTAD